MTFPLKLNGMHTSSNDSCILTSSPINDLIIYVFMTLKSHKPQKQPCFFFINVGNKSYQPGSGRRGFFSPIGFKEKACLLCVFPSVQCQEWNIVQRCDFTLRNGFYMRYDCIKGCIFSLNCLI